MRPTLLLIGAGALLRGTTLGAQARTLQREVGVPDAVGDTSDDRAEVRVPGEIPLETLEAEHDVAVLNVFARAGRTITLTANAWHRSGALIAEMAGREGLEGARLSKAFANDVLLALSCREAGCILVTDNDRDLPRIRRCVDFEFMQPWPSGVVA